MLSISQIGINDVEPGDCQGAMLLELERHVGECIEKPNWPQLLAHDSCEDLKVDRETRLTYDCRKHLLKTELLILSIQGKNIKVKKTVLRNALRNGCLWVIKELLKRESDVKNVSYEHTDIGNDMLLLQTTYDYRLFALKMTIDSVVLDRDRTLLHWSCEVGHLPVTELLIGRGAEVNRGDWNDWTPLHSACKNGHLLISQLLVENGADVNKNSEEKGTALHSACENGHLSVVQFLIENGAEVNRDSAIFGTPLHYACGNGHLSVVQLLCENRAEVNKVNYIGRTAMYNACLGGYLSVALYLIAAGADPDGTDPFATNPLNFSVYFYLVSMENDYFLISKLLIESNADVNRSNIMGETPLHHACEHGHLEIANLLLNGGAHVNRAENCGQTPLHLATDNGHAPIAQRLLEAGADIDTVDDFGLVSLHLAIVKGHASVLDVLMKTQISRELTWEL